MNQKRSSELEKVKGRVLSHIIKSSVLPPREALNDVPGQKAIVALETFLHETYLYVREEVLAYMLGKSLDPDILREERKLIRPRASKIGIVTVGSTKSKSSSSSNQSAPVPSIHLSGSYLDRRGFGINEKVAVFWGEKELILRPAAGCLNSPGQAVGGVANG